MEELLYKALDIILAWLPVKDVARCRAVNKRFRERAAAVQKSHWMLDIEEMSTSKLKSALVALQWLGPNLQELELVYEGQSWRSDDNVGVMTALPGQLNHHCSQMTRLRMPGATKGDIKLMAFWAGLDFAPHFCQRLKLLELKQIPLNILAKFPNLTSLEGIVVTMDDDRYKSDAMEVFRNGKRLGRVAFVGSIEFELVKDIARAVLELKAKMEEANNTETKETMKPMKDKSTFSLSLPAIRSIEIYFTGKETIDELKISAEMLSGLTECVVKLERVDVITNLAPFSKYVTSLLVYVCNFMEEEDQTGNRDVFRQFVNVRKVHIQFPDVKEDAMNSFFDGNLAGWECLEQLVLKDFPYDVKAIYSQLPSNIPLETLQLVNCVYQPEELVGWLGQLRPTLKYLKVFDGRGVPDGCSWRVAHVRKLMNSQPLIEDLVLPRAGNGEKRRPYFD